MPDHEFLPKGWCFRFESAMDPTTLTLPVLCPPLGLKPLWSLYMVHRCFPQWCLILDTQNRVVQRWNPLISIERWWGLIPACSLKPFGERIWTCWQRQVAFPKQKWMAQFCLGAALRWRNRAHWTMEGDTYWKVFPKVAWSEKTQNDESSRFLFIGRNVSCCFRCAPWQPFRELMNLMVMLNVSLHDPFCYLSSWKWV